MQQENYTASEEINNAIIIRLKKVQERTSLSRTTIWRKVSSGDFPAPVSLGERSIGWISTEIDEWIKNRPRVGYSSQTPV